MCADRCTRRKIRGNRGKDGVRNAAVSHKMPRIDGPHQELRGSKKKTYRF